MLGRQLPGRAPSSLQRCGLRKTHACKKEPKPEPAVTQEQLDELEPGDTIFHKAFGYERIIDIDEAYIEVTFGSDDKKKKPSRRFLFPGSFSQGLQQIG